MFNFSKFNSRSMLFVKQVFQNYPKHFYIKISCNLSRYSIFYSIPMFNSLFDLYFQLNDQFVFISVSHRLILNRFISFNTWMNEQWQNLYLHYRNRIVIKRMNRNISSYLTLRYARINVGLKVTFPTGKQIHYEHTAEYSNVLEFCLF